MRIAPVVLLLSLALPFAAGCSGCRRASGAQAGRRADRRVAPALVRWTDIQGLCQHKRVAPTRSCTKRPEAMFRHLVADPIPPGVTEIHGFGDCQQGHDLWLRFRVTPAARRHLLAGYRPFDCLASVFENRKTMGECTLVGHHVLCEFLAPAVRQDLFPAGVSDLPANVTCYFKKTGAPWGGCSALVASADGQHLYVRAFAP